MTNGKELTWMFFDDPGCYNTTAVRDKVYVIYFEDEQIPITYPIKT